MPELETNNPSEAAATAASPGLAPPVAPQALMAQLRRASELVSAQRLPEAESELVNAHRSFPRDLRVLKLLALVRFKLGRLAEAGEVYRDAVAVAPDDPAIRLNLGLIALKLESFVEAAHELEAAVHAQPDDRRAWSYLGYAYARSGAPAQAASAFRRAGQHELAAEMERAATPSAHSAEIAVVEGLSEVVPDKLEAGLAPSATLATPRPELRADATPKPELTPRPADAPPGEHVTLGDFTTSRLVTLDEASAPVAALGDGLVRFQSGPDTHVRESALLVALGGPGLALARRRIRGHFGGDHLAAGADRFFRVEGKGDLLLCPPQRERRLSVLSLERDVFYIEQERVMAWSDEVVWEWGRVPGNDKALLQFRGTGRVVIVSGDREIAALRISEGQCQVVPAARLAGWLGHVVVQAAPAVPNALPGLEYVTCEGEGVVLLSRHGEPR